MSRRVPMTSSHGTGWSAYGPMAYAHEPMEISFILTRLLTVAPESLLLFPGFPPLILPARTPDCRSAEQPLLQRGEQTVRRIARQIHRAGLQRAHVQPQD